MNPDLAIRDAAIRHCRLLSLVWRDAVPASELTNGFMVDNHRVHLVAWGRGIFKPKILTDGPLTLLSSLASSYADEELVGEEMLYDFAPEGSDTWANEGLKRAAARKLPLILLKQVKPKPRSEYMILAPVMIVAVDDKRRRFRLDLSTSANDAVGVPALPSTTFSKAYAETTTQARLHQAHFRRETLGAYRERCCICELRERPLLDAAHIVDDRLPDGVPTVRNGLSMCPTHHRGFDRGIIAVDEEYRIRVRRDRLRHLGDAATARMLVDYDTKEIWLPRDRALWPAGEFLRRKAELAA